MEPCLRGNDAKRVGKACHRVRRSFSADTTCRTRSALYTNTNVDDYGDGAAYTLKLGLAKDRLVMAGAQNHVAAAVFAENQVQVTKQYQVVGAIVSRFFEMGGQVPSVYQMPNLVRNLPPGMPGGQILNHVKILSWREI